MEVTCSRCSTTYEFDETLISTTGTTVKCTQCGHLFKVRRRSSLAPPGAESDPDMARELRWRVRRVDGSTHLLETLGDLSQLITAGQFARDDEVSRTGQVWKKLGDIQELSSLFDTAPPPRPRRSSMEGVVPLPPPPRVSEPPPPPPPPPVSSEAWRRSPPEREPRAQPPDAIAKAAPEPAPAPLAVPEPAVAASESAGRASDPDRDTTTEITTPPAPDEVFPNAPRRSGPLIVLALSLVIAAGGAALLWWPQPEPSVKPEDHPAREFLERGDRALAQHEPERFRDAIAAYEKALAFYPDDAHILSSISRAYAVWGTLLSFRIAAQRESGAAGADLASLQAELKRLNEFAKQYAERAAQRNPGNEEASVALSDALRLSGNLVAARAELDRARATEGVAKAETLRVAALLAVDEGGGDYHAGRSLAEQAVAREPTMLRARLLLARCLAADQDFEGARMHLDAASAAGVVHPIVEETRQDIARREHQAKDARDAKTAQAGAAPLPASKPDAGSVAPGPHPAPAPRETAANPSPRAAPTNGSGPASAKPREELAGDPAELVKRGEAALEQGAVPAAERLFDRALELDPGMPRARTGLGYVALERGQARMAVNHFRPAARGGNAEALIGLGDAYRRMGRMRDALAAYRDYLKSHPRGEHASIAQRQVELLSEQLNKP